MTSEAAKAALADDGAAFRLAVELGIEIGWYKFAGYAAARAVPASGNVILVEEYGSEACTTARRAIVKAAAAIWSVKMAELEGKHISGDITCGGGHPGDHNGEKTFKVVELLVRKHEGKVVWPQNLRTALHEAYLLGMNATNSPAAEQKGLAG